MLKFCLICPIKFSVRPSRVAKGYGLYCSRKCWLNSPSLKAAKERAKWLGKANKGKKLTEAQRKRISEGHKGIPSGMKGKIPWNKGKAHSQEIKNRISEAKKDKKIIKLKGEHNGNWKGGITSISKQIRMSIEYRQWQGACEEKYDNICQICFLPCKWNDMEVDHFPISFAQILTKYKIKTMEDALGCKELWNINNGRPVHKTCHKTTPTYLKPLAKHPLT